MVWAFLIGRAGFRVRCGVPKCQNNKTAESSISYSETRACDPQGDADREGATVPTALLINLFLLI